MKNGSIAERARYIADMARRAWVRSAIASGGCRNDLLNTLWNKYIEADKEAEKLEMEERNEKSQVMWN